MRHLAPVKARYGHTRRLCLLFIGLLITFATTEISRIYAKTTMKTLSKQEFGDRLVTLNTGATGLRAGLHFNVKEVAGAVAQMDFIGSDATVDRYNEVIDPGAWGDLKNFRANPVIPDCHDYSSVAKILGRAVSVEVRDGKLCDRVEFCLDNPLGNLAFKMARGGFLNSQSVGFIPEDWKAGNAGEPDRTYTKVELLEISMVVVPANPGATIGLALKSGAIEKCDLRDLADFLKQFCGKETDPDAPGGTSGAGVPDVRLLQSARSLRRVIASINQNQKQYESS